METVAIMKNEINIKNKYIVDLESKHCLKEQESLEKYLFSYFIIQISTLL